MADDIRCPTCGTDELHGKRAGPNAAITLTCDRCGHEWARQPEVSCPRCHTGNPYHEERWGWQFDDPAEARENPMASYDDVLRDWFRCRRCNHTWPVEVERHEGRGLAFRHSRAVRQRRRSRRQ